MAAAILMPPIVTALEVATAASATLPCGRNTNASGVPSPDTVVTSKVRTRLVAPDSVSVVVVSVLLPADAVCRTHTVMLPLTATLAVANMPLHPSEYSPPLTDNVVPAPIAPIVIAFETCRLEVCTPANDWNWPVTITPAYVLTSNVRLRFVAPASVSVVVVCVL